MGLDLAFRRKRQGDTEAGACSLFFDHGHMPLVARDDFPDKVQAQSGAALAWMQPVKRFEYQCAFRAGYAGTLVCNLHGAILLNANDDRPAVFSVFNGILHEIGHGAAQCPGIPPHNHPPFRRLEGKFITGSDGNRREIRSDTLAKLHQIDVVKRFTGLIDPLQIQHLLRQPGDAVCIQQKAGAQRAGGMVSRRVCRMAMGVRSSCAASMRKRWWRW